MPLTPPYSLLTRTAKGSQLTIDELDGNLLWLSTTMSGSINSITGSLGISGSNIEVVTSLFNLFSETLITGSVTINPNSIPNPISGSYTLDGSLIFNGDLTISSGSELIIPSGVALTLNGALINNGDLVNSGSYINLAPTSPYMTLSVLGNVSASGYYGDGSGLTGVTATTTLPAGLVSSSLQFTSTDDVTFRNITASNISSSGTITGVSGSFSHILGNSPITVQDQITFQSSITASADISSSGTITAGFYNIGNQAALIPAPDTLALADETGGPLGLFYTKTTNVTIGGSSAINGAKLGVGGNITAESHITASGNISASGNIEATGTGSFNYVYSGGDINIDNQGKLWLDGGSDSYIWLSNNNHIGLVAGNTQTLTVDDNSIEVDGNINTNSHITASGAISASGNIYANTGSFNYVITPIIEGSGSTALLHIEGDISASGYVSASSFSGDGSGLTGVTATATLPAGVVSSSLQFTATDDVTFRNITASGNISSSGTVTALTGSFGTITGLSPITVTDSITFQQPITASIISASTFSGDGSGLTNVPESTDIDVYLNFEEAASFAYIVPYNLQFAGFVTSSAMIVQISSSGAPYVFTSSLNQFSTLSVTSSAAGLVILSGSKL